jgi:hypothetical protein
MTQADSFFSNEPPPGWAKDEVSKFLETAYRNAWATHANLRGPVERLATIHGLFKTAVDALHNSPEWFSGFFLLKAHSHYLTASQLAMGCQIPEAYMVLRGSLESALYGYYLHKFPDSRMAWLSRHNDNASKKRVRDEFQIGAMLKLVSSSDGHLGRVTSELYERTIDHGAHPNERALSSSLQRHDRSDFIQFDYNYLNADPLPLQLALKTCAQVGICSLRIFKSVYLERFDLLDLSERIARASEGL